MSVAKPLNIALHHLYSNGDCLFATIVARQIKTDFPGCKLTWYVAKHCRGMVIENPDIDELIEIDCKVIPADEAWVHTEKLVRELHQKGVYDLVFSTQILNENEVNYTGTIRSSVLKNYGREITVNKNPYIYLTESEVANARNFVSQNNIAQYKNIVLFECMPLSGQVPMDPVKAEKLASEALNFLPDTCFILTSGQRIITESKHIYDASVLTIRENAELINHCTHIVGCSSGISWLAFSQWSKKIPMFQLMDNQSFYFNSFCRDSKILGEDSSHIIETLYTDENQLKQAIIAFVVDFDLAKKLYHQELKDKSRTIYSLCRRHIIAGKTINAIKILNNTYFLNKDNLHYYINIARLIVLYPLFVLFGLTRVFTSI